MPQLKRRAIPDLRGGGSAGGYGTSWPGSILRNQQKKNTGRVRNLPVLARSALCQYACRESMLHTSEQTGIDIAYIPDLKRAHWVDIKTYLKRFDPPNQTNPILVLLCFSAGTLTCPSRTNSISPSIPRSFSCSILWNRLPASSTIVRTKLRPVFEVMFARL